jgi:hypothetical protein
LLSVYDAVCGVKSLMTLEIAQEVNNMPYWSILLRYAILRLIEDMGIKTVLAKFVGNEIAFPSFGQEQHWFPMHYICQVICQITCSLFLNWFTWYHAKCDMQIECHPWAVPEVPNQMTEPPKSLCGLRDYF